MTIVKKPAGYSYLHKNSLAHIFIKNSLAQEMKQLPQGPSSGFCWKLTKEGEGQIAG